ncbi:16S rRNA (cytosine967-C5)-methyltransferase [Roseivivax halotolerans]|uniref:16S rRNA (Cytosine967-C5)-methyltransferase n=2 Tax=Roseivivax halotolerans TaxID=93684 RepID=A0A1I5Z761_9RHOB|nr:RsmB/NOP family class I SAM-dependent RNA methyltransferase [Roseivivax halotolerans]SFQ52185.1 16S rRNA (cytosine967-C5)-methyltransferase [Roseivivax halotolerans]
MTPGARVQAAIEVIDKVRAGMATEQALTRWARGARYAGSKDRAAVRDHVFDALRMWRSAAERGGGESGRHRMLGVLLLQGKDPAELFTGEGHAPACLAEDEGGSAELSEEAVRDVPDWIWGAFLDDHGPAKAAEIAQTLRCRAPITLRINGLMGDPNVAREVLAEDGIETRANPRADLALTVTEGARRVAQSRAYRDGLVELQDAASQAAIEALPLSVGMRVLDYCAGGGGKSLALAARLGGGPVWAHDSDKKRMRDLPGRAERAAADIRIVARPKGPFDLILCDVPCSGSGTWRRAPEAKWRFDKEDLADLRNVQREILSDVAPMLSGEGILVYATCSVMSAENDQIVSWFLSENQDFGLLSSQQVLPDEDGDGFYYAILRRAA